jgi:hypothetical protein
MNGLKFNTKAKLLVKSTSSVSTLVKELHNNPRKMRLSVENLSLLSKKPSYQETLRLCSIKWIHLPL